MRTRCIAPAVAFVLASLACSTLVPEELLGLIAAEGVIHFEPGGEELEGFSAHVWILMEAGEPKLATFYVED